MLTEKEYAECNLTFAQAAVLKLHGYSIIKKENPWVLGLFEILLNQKLVGTWDLRNNMWNIYTRNDLNINYRSIVNQLNKLLGDDSAF